MGVCGQLSAYKHMCNTTIQNPLFMGSSGYLNVNFRFRTILYDFTTPRRISSGVFLRHRIKIPEIFKINCAQSIDKPIILLYITNTSNKLHTIKWQTIKKEGFQYEYL